MNSRERADSASVTGTGGRTRKRGEWTRTREPSGAVVETVADATNRDPMDLPPLYDHVDTDALDAIVTRRGSDSRISISFTYAGADVFVTSDGTIDVTARADGD